VRGSLPKLRSIMPGDGSLEPFVKLLHFFESQENQRAVQSNLDSPEGKNSKWLLVARAGLDPATNGL
jgi:hypothetical protein